MTLGDIVARNAALYPHKMAVIDDAGRVTFAELATRSTRLAGVLADLGAQRGDRIAVLAPNRHHVVEVHCGCEMAGYITVPLNPRLTGVELAHVLTDCKPTALIFDGEHESVVAGLRAGLSSVKTFVCFDRALSWAPAYEQLIDRVTAVSPSIRPAPGDTAYILYTSGSTGHPKGVMLSHRGQILSGLSIGIDGNIDGSDRVLLPNPLYLAGGKWMQTTYHLRGCTVFLQQRFDPAQLMECIERERITAALLPATMLRAVLDHPDFARRDLTSLKTIYYAAGPTPLPLLQRALATFGPIMVQFYGGTEAGGVGTTLLKHQHIVGEQESEQRRLKSAGQAKIISRVRVVRDDGTDCDIDEPGEVIIASEGVMQGYWNNPAGTAEALRDGWVYTGDIGTFDEEQFVYIVGRKKEMIKSGGASIYTREVEEVLHSHPAVLEAAVIGISHEKWGEAVHAVVTKRPGHDVTEQEMIEYCRSRIASYKKPTSVAFLVELPKLDGGKVDKLALRAPFWAGRDRAVN